jgi:hypothetical protein
MEMVSMAAFFRRHLFAGAEEPSKPAQPSHSHESNGSELRHLLIDNLECPGCNATEAFLRLYDDLAGATFSRIFKTDFGGGRQYEATLWRGGELGAKSRLHRTLTFLQPVDSPLCKWTRVREDQCSEPLPDGGHVLQTSIHTLDVPYADCFRLHTKWVFRPAERGCTLSVSAGMSAHLDSHRPSRHLRVTPPT